MTVNMRRIVEDLIRVEGVIGSLLVGKDGLVVASTLMDEEDAEILGAMSAAVFGEIDKATRRIGVGALIDSIIDAEQGSILMLEARESCSDLMISPCPGALFSDVARDIWGNSVP
jgi:predicted regulator of Ras-like GTPase activity (Roadblock/LC7/MglB family)